MSAEATTAKPKRQSPRIQMCGLCFVTISLGADVDSIEVAKQARRPNVSMTMVYVDELPLLEVIGWSEVICDGLSALTQLAPLP